MVTGIFIPGGGGRIFDLAIKSLYATRQARSLLKGAPDPSSADHRGKRAELPPEFRRLEPFLVGTVCEVPRGELDLDEGALPCPTWGEAENDATGNGRTRTRGKGYSGWALRLFSAVPVSRCYVP